MKPEEIEKLLQEKKLIENTICAIEEILEQLDILIRFYQTK